MFDKLSFALNLNGHCSPSENQQKDTTKYTYVVYIYIYTYKSSICKHSENKLKARLNQRNVEKGKSPQSRGTISIRRRFGVYCVFVFFRDMRTIGKYGNWIRRALRFRRTTIHPREPGKRLIIVIRYAAMRNAQNRNNVRV